jgi:2-polyprenyl-3-methyl-5-hydroxy-6-metoxy-1,4-benzoquinol methylase
MTCPTCASEDVDPAYYEKDSYTLARCRSCGLAYVTNPPTPEELERFYSFASGYHVGFRDDPEEIANRFALARSQYEVVSRHHPSPGRCLDVGASAGFFVKTAVDHGWDAHGIELSSDTSQLARERYRVDVTSTRLEDAAFEPSSFDLVTLWDVIEHLPQPQDTMRRVAALLKPGGFAALITPNLDGCFARASFKVAKRLHYWPAVEPPAHLSQFSTASLSALLERAGLQPVEVKQEPQPRRLAYALAFAPFMLAGPPLGMGDQITVVAQRRS